MPRSDFHGLSSRLYGQRSASLKASRFLIVVCHWEILTVITSGVPMSIQCCPVCRGCGLHPDDRQLERVKDMRLCPVCEGLGEPPKEYPKHLCLYIENHLTKQNS